MAAIFLLFYLVGEILAENCTFDPLGYLLFLVPPHRVDI